MQPNSIARQQALELFLKTCFTQKQIAEMLNVNRKTVGLWIQQGKWHDLKNLEANTQLFTQQDLYTQLRALNNHINSRVQSPFPTVEESVVQRRLIVSVNSFDFQPLNDYVQIVLRFINDLRFIDPDLARQVEAHADFIIENRRNKMQAGAAMRHATEDDDLLEEETANPYAANSFEGPDAASGEANATLWEVKENYIDQQQLVFQQAILPQTPK